jgi:4'-phosphopantetheinyl transferase EntD
MIATQSRKTTCQFVLLKCCTRHDLRVPSIFNQSRHPNTRRDRLFHKVQLTINQMTPQSVTAAPEIAALFATGVVAYQTRETIPAAALLPEEQQFLSRAVPKRVHEFAAGRVCARAALAKLGYASAAVLMSADRAPLWPAGATGSITHTDTFCAAAVAPSGQIRALGLDAEPAQSVKPELWRRICTAQELALLQAQDEQSALAAATLIFSAKEAFYKCQYTLTREWLGFADISVTIDTDHFIVQATRSLQIAAQSPAPWRGQYRYEAGLVMTGVCIV